MDFTSIVVVGIGMITVSACLHLWGHYCKHPFFFYLFKPLTTLLIASLALAIAPTLDTYLYLILAGLIFSTLGDIFLMLPKDRFVPGLVSFLIAHVIYIFAFSQSDQTYTWFLIIPLVVIGLAVLWLLWSSLADMKIAVLVYMSVIIIMAWLASERYLVLQNEASLYACIGALVFLFSDATLAFDRFKRQFNSAYGFIIVSYYVAQSFIALSVV